MLVVREKLKVLYFLAGKIQLLKPESFAGSLTGKNCRLGEPFSFQSICDFSGIVYRTEPEKIFPANKPEFSL